MSTKTLSSGALRSEVEELFFLEADLLDEWRLDDWLNLLTEDASYFVPPNDLPDADASDTLFLVADDMIRLQERILRLQDPNCHAEFPHSRTRRFISNVRVLADDGGTLTVSANFIVYRHRRHESPRIFTGRYRNKLKRINGDLKIYERRAILDAEELGPMGAVSFIL